MVLSKILCQFQEAKLLEKTIPDVALAKLGLFISAKNFEIHYKFCLKHDYALQDKNFASHKPQTKIELIMADEIPKNTPEFRYGKVDEMDDSYDIAFWKSVSIEDKFRYTWRLTEIATELQGKSLDELRLQRAVGGLQRIQS